MNFNSSSSLTRKIIEYQEKSENIDSFLTQTNDIAKKVLPVDINKELLLEIHNEYLSKLNGEMIDSINEELREPKRNIESNFHLAFRGIIAISVYFFLIPQFGWILYSIVVCTIVGSMAILMVSYRFLDVLPYMIRKFQSIAVEYLKSHQSTVSVPVTGESKY